MQYDTIIYNGVLVDPHQGMYKRGNIALRHGRIEAYPDTKGVSASVRIDASGHYIVPGLIENHAHLYTGGSDMGVAPDLAMLPNGVTSVIDYGSAGYANYFWLSNQIIAASMCTVKAYLNVSAAGITADHQFEDQDPGHFRYEKIKETAEQYKGEIIGLKVRVAKEFAHTGGLENLKAALKIAERLGLPLAVHIKNPPVSVGQIAALLRKGDIWCHCYQQKGDSILDGNNRVKEEVIRAKRRGVLFDGASGRSGYTFEMLRDTLRQDFYPDFIGTDTVDHNLYERPMFNLLYMMSVYLNMGMEFGDVIRLCTEAPARQMGMEDQIGTLKIGADADICILELNQGVHDFKDITGAVLHGTRLLIPKMTIKNGKTVYRRIDF